MVLRLWTKMVDALSLKALMNRLDKRRLQAEFDTHRLLLLTSYHAAEAVQDAEAIVANAGGMQYEEMQAAVAANLRSQLLRISMELHELLTSANDAAALAAAAQPALAQPNPAVTAAAAGQLPRRRSGLAAAVGGGDPSDSYHQPQQQRQQQEERHAGTGAGGTDIGHQPGVGGSTPGAASSSGQVSLSMHQISQLFKVRYGFSLEVRASGVGHVDAGDGLWLAGGAGVGQVVALYPGLVYPPLQHRHLPGYPRIDVDNDYLMSRFDMVILDAKPWARGWPPDRQQQRDWPVAAAKSAVEQRMELGRLRASVEARHPLALAHFANHPPGGVAPNVMVAAFDVTVQPGELPQWQRYLPNLTYGQALGPAQSSPGHQRAAQQQQQQRQHEAQQVLGLALVALRPLCDEELLLNYRLSPHVQRPAWYVPVDAEEEQRRWA